MEFPGKLMKQNISELNLVGILNMTPDSFSDGGKFNAENFLETIREFQQFPSFRFVDVGGESTRPGAEEISWEEEWRRIEPILRILQEEKIPFSVDTRKLKVAERSFKYAPTAINDISGNLDIFRITKEAGLVYIAMHSRGTPENMQSFEGQPLDDLKKYFEPFMDYDKTLFDPGIGFGKSREQDLQSIFELLKIIPPQKIFIGASRKRLLHYLQGASKNALDREPAHLALISFLHSSGILWYRVHDVATVAQYLQAREKLAHDSKLLGFTSMG